MVLSSEAVATVMDPKILRWRTTACNGSRCQGYRYATATSIDVNLILPVSSFLLASQVDSILVPDTRIPTQLIHPYVFWKMERFFDMLGVP